MEDNTDDKIRLNVITSVITGLSSSIMRPRQGLEYNIKDFFFPALSSGRDIYILFSLMTSLC